ncbi:General transcription factor 3C polypeptide like [Actinidia chinensis var. chinensis]|uniref:General transcription factor 3C polypeptide like n=1 Tax=Actinidia chinensis var. chinensis TaxID=1590841 RepID=A0A2R6S0J6_ACTCC|nr:General transcription factor 3C polypeptide like [Actinidia chinensis var. chinensis]
MGVIKDGTISGNFPSAEAFAVHYPGYPSSTTRAVETLGGSEGILKARSLQSNKLELHFRPEDPYSHPAFGELHPCNSFLLRISKKIGRNGQSAEDNRISKCLSEDDIHLSQKSCPESVRTDQVDECESASQLPEEVQEDLSADIVTRISEAYQFNGMVDYQHVLAVHANVTRRKKRNWADMEPQFEKGSLMDVDQEDLMILVPPLFSIKDVPEKVVLKPPSSLSSKKKQKGVVRHRWEMDIEPSLAIDFNIKDIPKKVYWEKYIPKDSEQWEWQAAVSKLFDNRPIWVKSSLTEHLLDQGLQFGGHMLRRLLFRTAYYFSNGPFQRFWIRKGYDPRKDPESRIYQRIDFRVPPSLRSYCDANIASGSKHRWKDICSFQIFPYKCQTSLQLFELGDDYIQQEIRKPPQQATCSCTTGWFSSSVLDSLRFCIAVKFLSVYPEAGAESLLKTASERFKKSIKMQIYAKDSRPDEEVQQVNAEPVGKEDKEELDDDGDDEDEIDDDNVEEELDPHEEFHAAGEDVNFAPQPSSYTDNDNISKNYLQELFGSFPFGEVGGHGVEDAEDGEYHIYEQYSDGNYSDDDDY